MKTSPMSQKRRQETWLSADAGDFETFQNLVSQSLEKSQVPFATEVKKNVPLYDGDAVRSAYEDPEAAAALAAEWCRVFADGSGLIVIKNALPDHSVIDRATEIFESIIEAEKSASVGGGDHFAKPGANDRIWNSLQKHCLADPENFVAYMGNTAISLVCQSWLGDGYQMTAQVNRVNPGGTAQTPHRDYHLGFMSKARMAKFPAHVHALSPVLTLQGALAHCDMPVEAGPTLYLPFSQQFKEGYLAFDRPEFQAYFAEHHVQLPLDKGDAAFFNPALMHGAGHNRSKNIFRMGNLVQVSSAFGRAMETLDRSAMSRAVYPELQKGKLKPSAQAALIAATAEGYAFPTNLDLDPPVGGMAPKTQAELMQEALAADWSVDQFNDALAAMQERSKAG